MDWENAGGGVTELVQRAGKLSQGVESGLVRLGLAVLGGVRAQHSSTVRRCHIKT